MGIRYIEHSDMCGCERCALQWERETPGKVFDKVEDPSVLNCGCDAGHCNCWDDYGWDDDDED